MRVLMIDRQTIFIQGMSYGLRQFIPEISVEGVVNPDDVWPCLQQLPASMILIDGDTDEETCVRFLAEMQMRCPEIPVVVMVNTIRRAQLRLYMQHHVRAFIRRDSTPEYIAHALKSVMMGLMCLPSEMNSANYENYSAIMQLSARQKEILKLLAVGESNKQISRRLNISAGTVKAHLESIFRRLNVHNRTQAAMMYSSNE